MGNARNLADNLPLTGASNNRNIIINGEFLIDERHDGANHGVTAGSDFFADRWGFYTSSSAKNEYTATTEVVGDGPDGIEKSLKWTTASVTGSGIPATGETIFRHKIEGYNINLVNYGSANAQNLTLSFYVKASIAGNYGLCAQFEDSGSTNRYNQRSYTVNSANTWERKTVLIPANTANAMKNKTNNMGMAINWDFGEGATYSGSVTGNWQSAYINGLSGGVKLAENNGATWQITGVQLEIGNKATEFERESVGAALAKCQRYFYSWTSSGLSDNIYIRSPYSTGTPPNSSASAEYTFPVTMRANPTMTTTYNYSRFTASIHNAVAQIGTTSANNAYASTEWQADAEI